MKICSTCSLEKPFEAFSAKAKNVDGIRTYCRACASLADKRRNARKGPTARAERPTYEVTLDHRCCTVCKADKPADSFSRDKYQSGGLTPRCRKCDAARKVGRPSRQSRNRSWVEPKTEESILRKRLRGQLRKATRGAKNWRKTAEMVGYKAADLRAHLERQFTKGMGWHNAEKWHIDHIVPLASFNITDPDDPMIKVAWGLPNLRPLWAGENMSKGAQRVFLV